MEPNVKQYGGMAGSAGESDAVWLLQPDGMPKCYMMWLKQAVAQMHAHMCMMFFPHPQKTSCFHDRLLQPAAAVTAGGLQGLASQRMAALQMANKWEHQ